MIQRLGYDLIRLSGKALWAAWPVLLIWWAWDFAGQRWDEFVSSFLSSGDSPFKFWLVDHAGPSAALLGPGVIMAVCIALHRMGIASRTVAFTGIFGLAATALLTGWPEYQRLLSHAGAPGISPLEMLNGFDGPREIAIIDGSFLAFVGYCMATRVRPIGSQSYPTLRRGTSDNFANPGVLRPRFSPVSCLHRLMHGVDVPDMAMAPLSRYAHHAHSGPRSRAESSGRN